MSNLKPALLAALIPLAFAAPVLAQGGQGNDRPAMIFEDLDANSDGTLTLEELEARGAARFAEADANGDGQLSRDELLSGAEERMANRIDRMLERLDTNADGALSQEEIAARAGRRGPNPERMFERMDADGDGVVTEAEFAAAAERMMERRGHGGHGGQRDRG